MSASISFYLRSLAYLSLIGGTFGQFVLQQAERDQLQKPLCTVEAGGSSSIDDAPAILNAFEECGRGGTIKFENTTYHVNSVMSTTGLEDCDIDLQGTLKVYTLSP